MGYSDQELALLSRYFSTTEPRDHADIYLVRNLPPEVAATLNGVYSRTHLSMRDSLLERLKKGLAEAGRSLADLPLPAVPADLLTQVLADRSGQFLKTYAVDHGHNSLREGAQLHFAVENVSQLVTRFIQRERRCSFEESSTRYISFSNEGHWRDPEVRAAGGAAAAAYEEVLTSTFGLYGRIAAELLAFLERRRPLAPGEDAAAWKRALRAEAFDSARYLLTPALLTKWGVVLDARTLADMITELLSHPLAEFRTVGERLKAQGELVVKTLLTWANSNPLLEAQYRTLPKLEQTLTNALSRPDSPAPPVTLLRFDPDLDARLCAALAFEHSTRSFEDLTQAARDLGPERRASLWADALAARSPRDPLLLAFEGAQPFEFELLVDFGAYRDIGRHRKGFQQLQALTVVHGYATPPLLEEAGLAATFRATLDRAAELQAIVAKDHPLAAGYVTPFAFRQRARLVFDPRQVAYFIELRSGPEGHFAYREIAVAMWEAIARVSPLFAGYIRVQRGPAFLGRMAAELSSDERRRRRMAQAGD